MFLIVRDEDVPTVGSVITAMAVQHGLEPVEPEGDLLSMASMLVGPHVVLATGEDFVLVTNLASLPLGEIDVVGAAISQACGAEVVAIGFTASGVRVAVFDDGELDEDERVDVDPSGTTKSEALSEFAPTEDASEAFLAGVPAMNAVELAERILLLFGGDVDPEDTTTLAFADPSA